MAPGPSCREGFAFRGAWGLEGKGRAAAQGRPWKLTGRVVAEPEPADGGEGPVGRERSHRVCRAGLVTGAEKQFPKVYAAGLIFKCMLLTKLF